MNHALGKSVAPNFMYFLASYLFGKFSFKILKIVHPTIIMSELFMQ